ncbi:hypothetical protein BT96DRAFT_1003489 [Gymnopus androsaceus JB14]|uniref:Protein kinase domain-containing protein n=1 Tax=Gymnopus androsaceus JB14 TaxID=1447944 RepID=A0A6A4GV22_9AGAR|nr:hypothetical protein BT96DRAFT_1003489 [Gymnopus androsaceus JB14]
MPPPIQQSKTSTPGASTSAAPALPIYDYSMPSDKYVSKLHFLTTKHHFIPEPGKEGQVKTLEDTISLNIFAEAAKYVFDAYSSSQAISWSEFVVPELIGHMIWILYHCLKYQAGQKEYPLQDAHGQAHFHLRLLNAADPYARQLSPAQHEVLSNVWKKINDTSISFKGQTYSKWVAQSKCATKKQKTKSIMSIAKRHLTSVKESESGMSVDLVLNTYTSIEAMGVEATSVEETGCPSIYFINLKSGFHCVQKTIGGRLGRQELAVYKHLQEYCKHKHDSQHPGIAHFILEWSIGHWSAEEYLQLPHHIPVSEEMRKGGSYLESHALLLCAQLSEGINFLYSQLKVAHMDIKPDNLVLAMPQFIFKIIDFNLYCGCESHDNRCSWDQGLLKFRKVTNTGPSLQINIHVASPSKSLLRNYTVGLLASVLHSWNAPKIIGSTGPNGWLMDCPQCDWSQFKRGASFGTPTTQLVSAAPVRNMGILHSQNIQIGLSILLGQFLTFKGMSVRNIGACSGMLEWLKDI